MNESFSSAVMDVRIAGHFRTNLEAIEAIHATLRTVSDCVAGTTAEIMAGEMPAVLAASVRKPEWSAGESLTAPEFAKRVALREQLPLQTAQWHTVIVLHMLGRALSGSSICALRAALPDELGCLLAGTPVPEESHMHQPIR